MATGARTALIFAPHPDDEVIIGGLPLRLLRELKIDVVNVAVTLGSRADRQAERWQELKNCCDYIGFGLVAPAERGLEGINPVAKEKDPQRWSSSVEAIAKLLNDYQPSIIFFPHDDDWNKTHIGVHRLLVEALGSSGLACLVVETEFWGAMDAPNLMVESSAADVADLVAALSLHVGEVCAKCLPSASAGLDDRQRAPRGRTGRRSGRSGAALPFRDSLPAAPLGKRSLS